APRWRLAGAGCLLGAFQKGYKFEISVALTLQSTIGLLRVAPHLLGIIFPDRNNHVASRCQLINERLRNFPGTGRDQDTVKRGEAGQSCTSIAQKSADHAKPNFPKEL